MQVGEEAGLRVLGVEHADHRAAEQDRDRQLGPARLIVADVARVLEGVGDQDRLASARDGADDALAVGDPDRREDLPPARVLRPVRGALDQVLAGLVEQVDHAVLEPEAHDQVLGDVPQDVVEVGRRVQQRGREVGDDVEVLSLGRERGAARP